EQQLFEETVFREVSFGPVNWGFSPEETRRNVTRSLSIVGIGPDLYESNPFKLSGGQKRRVAIASVLASEPDYLVLDEPTAGLDLGGKKDLINLLTELRSTGKGIVHITHDLDLALSLADIVLVLDRGKILLWGPPVVILEELAKRDINGLVVPPVVRFASRLREIGMDVPLTWEPERLARAICAEVKK
ncbi:MAG TPA: ATP-binding cassette domain-containing protein, partial [Synergistetes bacterium]|nr:ATP-binding cassette domain-containing protein [Synergistota bacterium]